MDRLSLKLQAAGYFKDWSNYLLVTTVAAIGWVSKGTESIGTLQKWSLAFLTISAALGIVSLSMIPHMVQNLEDDGQSIYQTRAVVWFFPWQTGRTKILRLKHACWPQHACFISGITLYIIWAWSR